MTLALQPNPIYNRTPVQLQIKILKHQRIFRPTGFPSTSTPANLNPVPLTPRHQVLLELKEYAQEVDVDFVRKVRLRFRSRLQIPAAQETPLVELGQAS